MIQHLAEYYIVIDWFEHAHAWVGTRYPRIPGKPRKMWADKEEMIRDLQAQAVPVIFSPKAVENLTCKPPLP